MRALKHYHFGLLVAIVAGLGISVQCYMSAYSDRTISDDQNTRLYRLSLVGRYASMPIDRFIDTVLSDKYDQLDIEKAINGAVPSDLSDDETQTLYHAETGPPYPDRLLEVIWWSSQPKGWYLSDLIKLIEFVLAGFLGGCILAEFLSVSWTFLLTRIRELSLAIRGQ